MQGIRDCVGSAVDGTYLYHHSLPTRGLSEGKNAERSGEVSWTVFRTWHNSWHTRIHSSYGYLDKTYTRPGQPKSWHGWKNSLQAPFIDEKLLAVENHWVRENLYFRSLVGGPCTRESLYTYVCIGNTIQTQWVTHKRKEKEGEEEEEEEKAERYEIGSRNVGVSVRVRRWK